MENQILIALKNNKLLKNILFDDLNVSGIKGELLTISEGEILFREGNDSEFLYLVVSGEINVLRKQQGSKAASLIFNDHDFLGCEEFIENSKRQATAVALRDSYIIALTKSEVDNLIDQNDEILHNIYESINVNEQNSLDSNQDIDSVSTVDFTSSKIEDKPAETSFAAKVFHSDAVEHSKYESVPDKSINPEGGQHEEKDTQSEEGELKREEHEDTDFTTSSFSIPSSEISADDLSEDSFENKELPQETGEEELANKTAETIEPPTSEFISSEDQLSQELEEQLKESIAQHDDPIKSEIEEETKELLDSYDSEMNQSQQDSVSASAIKHEIPEQIDETIQHENNVVDEFDKHDHSVEKIEQEIVTDEQKDEIVIPETESTPDSKSDDTTTSEIMDEENAFELKEETIKADEVADDLKYEETGADTLLTQSDETDEEQLTDQTYHESGQTESLETTTDITTDSEAAAQHINEEELASTSTINFIPNESQFAGYTGEQEKATEDIPDQDLTGEQTERTLSHQEQFTDASADENKIPESVDDVPPTNQQLPADQVDESSGDPSESIEEKLSDSEKTAQDMFVSKLGTSVKSEDFEASDNEITDDVFKNYDDQQSLDPLIPSSYKLNFRQKDNDSVSNTEDSEKLSDEKLNEFSEQSEPEPSISDDDFNFDERFGKIDPFYDAELDGVKTDETLTEEPEDKEKIEDQPTEDKEVTGVTKEEPAPFISPALPVDIPSAGLVSDEPRSEVDSQEEIEPEPEEAEDESIIEEQAAVEETIAVEELAKEKCEQTVELLQKINKAAEQVNSNIKIDEVLKNIVNAAVELTNADRGTLYIVDKDKNELWSKVAMGSEFKEIKLNIGEGIAGWVAQNGNTINLDKVQDDPRFNVSFDKLSGYTTKTMLCFPIKDRQAEVVGVLQLLNSKNGIFSKLDEEFLESLSIHAAMALQNAGLVEKLLTSERVSSLGKMANFLIQDIKKPVMVSKRYAEHLKSKSLEPDISRVIDMLLDQLNHIADLVQSTSSYSEGQIVLRSIITNLNETIDDYISRLDSFLRAANCQINKEYDNETSVKISEKQFYQAYQSIIKNACQAMPEGCNIYITTQKIEDRVLIKIKDQGLGIPDSLHDKIFEPFMTHGKKDATGLGLSIAKKIIEEHGGKVSLSSIVGEGATFVIDLPIVYAV